MFGGGGRRPFMVAGRRKGSGDDLRTSAPREKLAPLMLGKAYVSAIGCHEKRFDSANTEPGESGARRLFSGSGGAMAL